MSLQSQYGIGLYRDVNPTKSQYHHNIACSLGKEAQNSQKIKQRVLKNIVNSG